MTRPYHTILLLLIISVIIAAAQEIPPAADTAEAHHQRGVESHLRRCLDDASREYARALELDPPRDLNSEEWRLVRRFAPRLYTTPSEFFPLKDFAVILHPTERLIAYHFFWEDDIDFPEDNDPCDHELIWVKYSADKSSIENVLTYFHGRILEGGEAAINDALSHGMRPRVNIQWGKHGSLPVGWEELTIVANPGDAEKKYYPLDQPITLKQYQEGTFRKLSEEGRRLADHPLGLRLRWPQKFNGKWEDFVSFSRLVEPLRLLDRTKMARVSRWNSATINQHFLTYNFRPKTEWPAKGLESQILLEKRFSASAESEALLDLTASAPGTSWRERGAEAAIVTIYVDGQYHQDVILFAGAREFTYQLMLGRVGPGEHRLRVEFNRKQSAAKTTSVKIGDAKITTIDRRHPEFQAIARAPFLYARPDTIGKFSDIPLLAYYESERASAYDRLTYTVIFSNEDGGTQTTALMARWGRTTDIEWVYETRIGVEGETSAIFQGADHKDTRFAGKLEADHPLMFVATVNNNFSDRGRSEMRFAPRPLSFDTRTASREEMMDRHPWSYRVMADEMIREEKITDERKPGQSINDLRNYIYFDIGSNQTGAALSVAVKLKGDPVWRASDWGIANYRIDRSGNFRTTALLPKRARLEEIERIVARCNVKGDPKNKAELSRVPLASCDLRSINKIFVLDDDYLPGESLKLSFQPVKMSSGEMVEIYDAVTKR